MKYFKKSIICLISLLFIISYCDQNPTNNELITNDNQTKSIPTYITLKGKVEFSDGTVFESDTLKRFEVPKKFWGKVNKEFNSLEKVTACPDFIYYVTLFDGWLRIYDCSLLEFSGSLEYDEDGYYLLRTRPIVEMLAGAGAKIRSSVIFWSPFVYLYSPWTTLPYIDGIAYGEWSSRVESEICYTWDSPVSFYISTDYEAFIYMAQVVVLGICI